ncbi:hypothetical protein [Candidatus Poriferisodalis sp.]|uniref:hypothetical protein n=1 Tax=Candidatus Poriferisodalis sp. TaxID=3101277 RepID=UPI003C700CB0
MNPEGEELVLAWNTVAGNKRREDVQALVVEMTAPFGIGWEIINYDAGELFQNRLPVLNFGPVALFANSTDPDPSVTVYYDIEGVPTSENGYSGQNFTAYRSQAASDLAFAIDARWIRLLGWSWSMNSERCSRMTCRGSRCTCCRTCWLGTRRWCLARGRTCRVATEVSSTCTTGRSAANDSLMAR